jgi:FkbM family methyltransferase
MFDSLGIPPKMVVEVGAYEGDDALRLKRRYPSARVVTFEADPANYAITLNNLRDSGVEVVFAAVTDHDNGVDFWLNDEGTLHRPASNDGYGNRVSGSILRASEYLKTSQAKIPQAAGFSDAPIHVPSTRLDNFCKGAGITAIDIMQVDVQGAESFVLKGLGELRPKIIFLEINETADFGRYLGGATRTQLNQLLQGMGYEKHWDNDADALYFHP